MDDSSPLRTPFIPPVTLMEHMHNGYITSKNHPKLPLTIHNYTQRGFSSSASTSRQSLDLSIACRSLITETHTGNVISRSFSKFFNHHEKLAYKPTGSEYAFEIEEKLDGSIISLFCYHDEWMMSSRSSFEGPHIDAAWKVLTARYPQVIPRRGEKTSGVAKSEILDKEKTYVFELVDPTMPIKVRYTTKDMVLLAIIAKDGQEPTYDFDWSQLPFTRPKMHKADKIDTKELHVLNRDNEEGFVVKFWPTKDDTHPQRIKVKFESYLKRSRPFGDDLVDSMSNVAISQKQNKKKQPSAGSISFPTLPTPASLVDLYIKHRLELPHFVESVIDARMELLKTKYMNHLEDTHIADDYGDSLWLEAVSTTWNRIHALFTLHEDEWRRLIEVLQNDGFRRHGGGGKASTSTTTAKQGKRSPESSKSDPKTAFQQRIAKPDIEKALRAPLLARYEGADGVTVVRLVIEAIELPGDLRSEEVIVLQ